MHSANQASLRLSVQKRLPSTFHISASSVSYSERVSIWLIGPSCWKSDGMTKTVNSCTVFRLCTGASFAMCALQTQKTSAAHTNSRFERAALFFANRATTSK